MDTEEVTDGHAPHTSGEWGLSCINFLSNGMKGSLICDTGAGETVLALKFARAAGLKIRPTKSNISVIVANGERIAPVGRTDLPIMLQLMLQTDDGVWVHWDRLITLRNVLVLDLGEDSPRDLYVSWPDWRFSNDDKAPISPLGSLAQLVLSGATVADSPRAPLTQDFSRVVVQRDGAVQPRCEVPLGAMLPEALNDDELAKLIRERIPKARRDSPQAKRLVDMFLARRKILGPVDPAECTQAVDFELIDKGVDPPPVSFKVNIPKGARRDAAVQGLYDWIERGNAHTVAWDTPAYGFVIVVPKANGKFRVTISPTGVNAATKREDPEGGYLPDNMQQAAQSVGQYKLACLLDMREAFTILKLGPEAQRLSTFTSPVGKLRFTQGYFGYHSFPAIFQRVIMESVVLPAMDQVPDALILAWIDDILAAADNADTLLDALEHMLDSILKIGGRLSLEKCHFLIEQFDWCGVEVCLKSHKWRIARERVSSLMATPLPDDRDALTHLLGILRYYYWGVADQKAQRARLAKLSELDVPGIRLKSHWTPQHTTAMQEAIQAITEGEWTLVFDPTRPVYVTTDASGLHGYAVCANQYDPATGKLQPISYHSHGWLDTQLLWTAQVKEAYAARQAVVKIAPAYFPYADIILLVDNKNLASRNAESADPRVKRWKFDIDCSGCVQKHWIPGQYNTIADYGSRSVRAQPDAKLNAEQKFDLNLYSILGEGERTGRPPTIGAALPENETPVPGHYTMAPLTKNIAQAQLLAPPDERAAWTGTKYSTAQLGGYTLALYDNLLVVPKGAADLKTALLKLAHDDSSHYGATDRTLHNLKRQARVHWVGIHEDTLSYVGSCFRCQMTKTRHETSKTGQLSPTVAPSVHHTWYADFKGPFPFGTGYLLCVTEAVTRAVAIRYVSSANGKELCEELDEVISKFGTAPAVIRSDSGQPFDSHEYREYCTKWGIKPILGVPYHSQGQGMVESRFRGIAAAIMATLGAKAPRTWFKGSLLAHLELIINSTLVEPIGGSPAWALTGREPRTPLSAAADWTQADWHSINNGWTGALSLNDLNEIIAAHHGRMNAVQGRVHLATSLAQALTKRTWDAAHTPGDFKPGQWVLLHTVAPNKLMPHYTGPYQVATVTADNNFVTARHFLSPLGQTDGPFHVSRLLHFDMSRADPAEIASFQLEAGSAIVRDVLDHRKLADGTYEYLIQWLDPPVSSWLASAGLMKVTKVLDYCRLKRLPPPGKEFKKPTAPAAVVAPAGPPPRAARAATVKR